MVDYLGIFVDQNLTFGVFYLFARLLSLEGVKRQRLHVPFSTLRRARYTLNKIYRSGAYALTECTTDLIDRTHDRGPEPPLQRTLCDDANSHRIVRNSTPRRHVQLYNVQRSLRVHVTPRSGELSQWLECGCRFVVRHQLRLQTIQIK